MEKKTELLDVTFLLLVRLDTIERLENTLAIVEYLASSFSTNIHLLECGSYNNHVLEKLLPNCVLYSFKEDYDPILYRTKYLNQMTRSVKTKIVAIWDVDVILPTKQIHESVQLLRNNKADFVYPYEKNFLETTEILRRCFLKKRDITILERYADRMRKLYSPNPCGGAFFCNTNSYIASGMENEAFYGWGVEDGERKIRWIRLGYKIEWISGCIYHLTHPRGINSGFSQPLQKLLKLRKFHESFRISNIKI